MTKQVSRRSLLKTAVSGVTMASLASMSGPEQKSLIPRKGQIKQSVSRWCYQKIPLDDLAAASGGFVRRIATLRSDVREFGC